MMGRVGTWAVQAAVVLAILAVTADAATAESAGAIELAARADFSRGEDVNYDNWPDRWLRRSGRDYPLYQKIEIVSSNPEIEAQARRVDEELLRYWQLARTLPAIGRRLASLPPALSDALAERYLSAELDGGGVWVQGPSIDVDSAFSYRLVARMMTEGLQHDRAWLELVFYDAAGAPVRIHGTPPLDRSSPWQTVSVGPIAAPPAAHTAALRLRVAAEGTPDISGRVGLDAIRLFRMPQMSMRCDREEGLYAADEPVVLSCRLSGLVQPELAVRFELFDHRGQVLERAVRPVQAHPAMSHTDSLLSGTAVWELAPMPVGFYRVRAYLEDSRAASLRANQTFAVLGQLPPATGSPFGWSLTAGHADIPRRRLPAWLSATRVGWIKYPCWLPAGDHDASNDLAWLLERLQGGGIQPVGVLDQPPESVRHLFPGEGRLAAAHLFRETEVWQPLLESQMTRLSMKLDWWQLGGDRDYSFLSRSEMVSQIEGIRTQLQGLGQTLSIALPWPWFEPTPVGSGGGWRAECLGIDAPLTAEELEHYLAARDSGGRATWLLLDPLARDRYDLATRVRDLVKRMIVVRRHEVSAAFVSNPFDPRLALLRPDGTPDEMLLPWRTAASLLGPLRYAGRLQLPGGSENALLSDGERAVLVVWNMRGGTEELYLGEEVEQVDVWGVRTPLPKQHSGGMARQRIEVGPWPIFLVGIDPRVAVWRQGVEVIPSRLDSILGRPQEVTIRIRNPLDQAISGQLSIHAPETWQAAPRVQRFHLEAGGSTDLPTTVRLRRDATTGRSGLRIDLEVESDRSDRFSVWREMEVGPADVEFELTSRLDEQGRLVVRQEVLNLGDQPQRYDCHLITGVRERQRGQVAVDPGMRVGRTYYWPDGKELVGRTIWLQAIEINGQRVLNYRLIVQP